MDSFNYRTIKAPARKLNRAAAIVEEIKPEARKYDEALEKWKIDNAVFAKGGSDAVREYQAKQEEAKAALERAQAAALERIERLRGEALAYIQEQITPNGEDIDSDMALFSNDLIDNEEQLAHILAKHDNAAFRIAARNYADKRGWKGFDSKDKSESVIEFTNKMFDMVVRAVENPKGMAILQLAEPNEFQRLAANYDILDCWQAGLKG